MPADRPYRTRPLAGVDQALAEGHAREPAELLDQLRERLDRLPQDHPSARPLADASPEDATEYRSGSSSLPKNGADRSSGGSDNQGAGQPPAADRASEPATTAPAESTATPPEDQYRVIDIGRPGPGEPYR